MLSGAEYDFRQGCTGGKGHMAWAATALALVGASLGTRHTAGDRGKQGKQKQTKKHTNAPKSKDRHET